VLMMKQFNICFLIVVLHTQFGPSHMQLSCLLQHHSISHMFGNWLWGISKELKPLVLLGAATTCWSLWLCRNDVVFERKPNTSPL
jgi:hypothetical protein